MDIKVSRPAWSRCQYFGLDLGLKLVGLGLGLGLMAMVSGLVRFGLVVSTRQATLDLIGVR